MKNDDNLDAFLKNLIDSGKSPGLQYVVLQDDTLVYQQNLGMAEFETNKIVTEKTFFNACSVTKTFTSLAILQLAEAGRIHLSDYASVYLDKLPFQTEIKISQFLSHTSGLANPIPLRWAHLREEDADFDSDTFIRDVLQQHARLKYTPGEKFSYSNLNYLPLGQIIEKVSGMPYRDFIRQNIIAKIGLGEMPMDFIVSDDTHYARGYQKKFTLVNGILGFLFDKKKFTTKSSNPAWIKFNKYYVSGRAYGGLITNAYSLSKFIRELFREHSILLSADWKKILFTKQKTNSGKEVGMTLGWFTGKLNGVDYYAHAGAGGGYYCEMRSYPQHNMISAIMFNRSGIRDERFLDKPDSHFLSGLH
jgi:CubicO group peptidase (beta-lactamase class C family)